MRGATPPFVPQISDCSSLLCIYNEGEALVCDQRLCYVTIETPIEVRSITTAAHPRLELCPAHRSFVAGLFGQTATASMELSPLFATHTCLLLSAPNGSL
ncbi:tuzin [Trypanosoma cruzi cruzi]|nr:tuzin [Trypanosoma cruzi cruzi]PBJ78141.1 tuzin [Trypanosoma cruzi cruzi]PBJ78144.1 tuzin [Trypanosoma cruzi cruzi]